MKPEELHLIQQPLKEKYRATPESAFATLSAVGQVDFDSISCPIIKSDENLTIPGLHPMAGGNGQFACAAEMLLESLIGCAGVTLAAVCTAMQVPVETAFLTAEGDVDFRGTLGVDRATPVGFIAVRLIFEFDSAAPDEKLAKAVQLAERYCVVAQTLKEVSASWKRRPPS